VQILQGGYSRSVLILLYESKFVIKDTVIVLVAGKHVYKVANGGVGLNMELEKLKL
jgi:hypothetical protein